MTATQGGQVPGTGGGPAIKLSDLLGRPLTARDGESLGRLSDVIVRLRGDDRPLVTGLVGKVGKRQVFIPIGQVSLRGGEELKLASARLDLRRFERRAGEVLLRADLLGHRLIDVEHARLVRAVNLQLAPRDGEWLLSGVATRRPRPLLGLLRHGPGGMEVFRDQGQFEALIGHTASAVLRGPFARVRRLKPAQIADLLEEASTEEQTEILGRVHADPELEADVFEELDEDKASQLFGTRSDAEVAEVLGRMRADDAADAITELPQRRRQPVLDLLPPGQRTKVLTLMGFNPTSAGGLMNVDFLALPAGSTAEQVIAAVRSAVSIQPEALTSVHAIGDGGRLLGVARLAAVLQADPAAELISFSDTDPVRVGPNTDAVDVAVLMTDYNLMTIPVVDDRSTMLGVITVDDVLEVTLPEDWRRREAAEPPDSRPGGA
jgi:CBS domain-containing protein